MEGTGLSLFDECAARWLWVQFTVPSGRIGTSLRTPTEINILTK